MFDAATTNKRFSFSGNSALSSDHQSNDLMIGIASRHHPCRTEVESFIQAGFKRAHDADIHSFMPTLLYAKGGKLKSAMGIRSASEATFVEHYLPHSLQETLAGQGICTSRSKVVEIGNLHSTSARFTQQLLLCVAVALSMCKKEFIIFTGIPKVTRIFEQFNIPLTPICSANQSAVSDGPDTWGSYYEDAPQVLALNIKDTMAAIENSPKLSQLRKSLNYNIFIIHQHLKENLG